LNEYSISIYFRMPVNQACMGIELEYILTLDRNPVNSQRKPPMSL